MVLSEHQRQLGFEGVPVAGNEFLSTGRPPCVIHPPPCSQTVVPDGYDRLSEPCRPAPSTERGGCTRSSGALIAAMVGPPNVH
eukprot:COSAG01_NODE_1056_length_11893_cov_439.683332_13_plen_83_part_00